jgi:hypothetical protein
MLEYSAVVRNAQPVIVQQQKRNVQPVIVQQNEAGRTIPVLVNILAVVLEKRTILALL